MAGKKLKERAYSELSCNDIGHLREFLKEIIHHIEIQDKQIAMLKRKNDRLECKYWEIKLRYKN